jgi:hypothetical protein
MGYAIALVEASQARDDQLAVWERNLALPVSARRRFDWLYRDNPAGAGRLAVLQDRPGADGAAVGTAGYGRRGLSVAGAPRTAAVLADLAVDRAHRTAMPALMLARELRREVLAHSDVVYAFPNEHAGPLLLRLGYRALGVTRRFALPLRHGRHVTARLRSRLGPRLSRLVGRAAGFGLDAAHAAIVSARAGAVWRDYRLVFVADAAAALDARFDRLWEAARGDYPIVGVRDAAFLRWRFVARPEGPLQLVLLLARGGGLRGYAVLDRVTEAVHIRDLFAREADLDPLLRLLSGALARRKAASISLRLCGAPGLVETLLALGFRERSDHRTIIVDAGTASAAAIGRVDAASDWYLTDADEDA